MQDNNKQDHTQGGVQGHKQLDYYTYTLNSTKE
jgi:hypothetical protein